MKMKTSLVVGKDCFTLLGLLAKAATYKGLKLLEGSSEAYSEPVKTYVLNDKLLALLAERGIKRQARSDCNHEIFTLVDENPQEKVPGWAPGNYWNFRPLEGGSDKFNLKIELCVGFTVNSRERGIGLVPMAHSPFLSPADYLPNFRMFKTLVENDEDVLAVAKEIASSDGTVQVTWTDLGVGGIRTLEVLFGEFAGDNEKVRSIALRQEVFDPMPYPRHQKPGDKLFVVETAQPRVFQAWQDQLKEYISHLAIA